MIEDSLPMSEGADAVDVDMAADGAWNEWALEYHLFFMINSVEC